MIERHLQRAHGGRLDAAALRRRGTASAGRHEFDAARAEFARAGALDAHDPENFNERGLALRTKD